MRKREAYTSGARGAALRLAFGLALGLVLAEGVTRALGLGQPWVPPPVLMENPDKTAALECYPPGRVDPPDLDLSRADLEPLAARLGRGADELARVARTTPLCVEFAYNDQTRRAPPFEPSTEPTLLLIGDSFTEGQGVTLDDTFAARLGRSTPYRVLNGGRRGEDLPDQLGTLRRLLPLTRPDVVVYALTLNDFEQDPEWAARQAFLNDLVLDRQRTGAPGEGPASPLSHLALWTFVTSRRANHAATVQTLAWYRGMTGSGNAGGWQRTRDDLAAMRDETATAGAELRVAVLPMLVGLRGTGGAYPLQSVHDELLDTCSQLGIRCFDVRPALSGPPARELWVHRVDMHPNAEAHRRIADAIAAELPPAP